MSVKIINLSTDFVTNVSEVTVQITENVGRIVRVKDTLTVPLPGRFEAIDDALMEALFAELTAQGLNPFPDAG